MTDLVSLPYRPCAGVMLVNSENLVFVGQRLDTRYDAWQMPQGGIDEGEEPEAAALREIGEETGIAAHHVELVARSSGEYFYDLPHELISKMWNGRFRGQRQIWFLARFLGRNEDINIATEQPEFRTWKWAPRHELVDLIVPFKKELYANVVSEFAPHF